jgi:hypothetical protein
MPVSTVSARTDSVHANRPSDRTPVASGASNPALGSCAAVRHDNVHRYVDDGFLPSAPLGQDGWIAAAAASSIVSVAKRRPGPARRDDAEPRATCPPRFSGRTRAEVSTSPSNTALHHRRGVGAFVAGLHPAHDAHA